MSPLDRASLAHDVARAGRIVAPLWPTERFVAVNPMLGLLSGGFDEAVAEARDWLGVRGLPDADRPARRPCVLELRLGLELAEEVDALVHDWLLRLVPGGDGDVYARWRDLAARDRRLWRLAGPEAAGQVLDLPARADDAVLAAVERLGLPAYLRWSELRAQMVRSLGWAGYATWCDAWAAPDDPAPRLSLLDLLAIRTSLDALVLAVTVPSPAHHPSLAVPPPAPVDAARERLELAEAAYRTELVTRLQGAARQQVASPRAQVVCCIDARSEGLRRHLEQLGPYDTIGFAGFFGVAARVRPAGAAEAHASAPVLLSPTVELVERAVVRPRRGDGSARRGVDDADRASSHGPAAFGWAEGTGWALGLAALVRSARPPATGDVADPPTEIDVGAFDLATRAHTVETALRTMGLTGGFAPIVVLCGHGSTTTANPHGAALDCGACAGHRGGDNARALATMANDPEVREILTGRGITIPPETWFVAAEHDTTTDAVGLLDRGRAPHRALEALEQVADDLARAGAALAAEREVDLPGGRAGRSAAARARRRAGDWSQVRAEWGLARNAAFVVAPRTATRGVDLDRRSFLHSYDPVADTDGTALETILTAPMVVAHWISAQYFASTVDPEVLGAGDKTTHNPVPGVGVLAGGGGDLRVGLPWQSVAGVDGPYHEPLRLLTVVEAPAARVEEVVARNPILQHLFDGGWVHLVVHEPGTDRWVHRLPGGAQVALTPEEVPCPSPV